MSFDEVYYGPHAWRESSATAFIEAYPAGQEVWVYYNPYNPSESVLDRRISVIANVPQVLIGLALLSGGLAWVIVSL